MIWGMIMKKTFKIVSLILCVTLLLSVVSVGGFAAEKKDYSVQVEIPQELLNKLPKEKQAALLGILSQDPRPAYQDDPERLYGLSFAGFELHFKVNNGILTVMDMEQEG